LRIYNALLSRSHCNVFLCFYLFLLTEQINDDDDNLFNYREAMLYWKWVSCVPEYGWVNESDVSGTYATSNVAHGTQLRCSQWTDLVLLVARFHSCKRHQQLQHMVTNTWCAILTHNAQYTPPTRLNCRVESRQRCDRTRRQSDRRYSQKGNLQVSCSLSR